MRNRLDAREYKLLLNPEKFPEPLSEEGANRFWEEKLVPIIATRLDKRDGGAPRAAEKLDKLRQRNIRFWDTADCALAVSKLSLRSRAEDVDPKVSEVTLKLRMADYFVVAGTALPASVEGAETEFEEDIAPLEVMPAAPSPGVVFPARYSIRSRYFLSTGLEIVWDHPTDETLHDLFPTLEALLKRPLVSGRELMAGPSIYEFAAKGAAVILGANMIGRFTLSTWYFGERSGSPDIAEISFKCDLSGGNMPGKVARRALDLFIGMQADLGDYVNSAHSSKTEMALPKPCAAI